LSIGPLLTYAKMPFESELAFGGDSFVFFDDTLEANMGMVTSNCEDINVVN